MYLPGKQQRAYTLIEILIALFVFAIISVIVVMVLQNIIGVRDRVQGKSDAIATLQRAVTLLSRDVEQIIHRRIRNTKGQVEASVLGDNSQPFPSLTFTRAGISNPGSIDDRSTLQRVRYHLKDKQLIRESWETLDRHDDTAPTAIVLLDKVNRFSLQYIDKNQKVTPQWPPTGRHSPPPRAIEASIEIEGWGEIRRLMLIPTYAVTIDLDAMESEQKNEDE